MKSVRSVAGGMAAGAVAGAAFANGLHTASWAGGDHHAPDAGEISGVAIGGAALGAFIGGVYALSSGQTHKEKMRDVVSALWAVATAYFGSASLGTAFPQQDLLVSGTIRLAEMHSGGAPYSAEQRLAWKLVLNGPAWAAISPILGLEAALIGLTMNGTAALINHLAVQCDCLPPIRRIANPGFQMLAFDSATVALGTGAGVRSGRRTRAALDGHPAPPPTAREGLEGAHSSGTSGGAATSAAILAIGLRDRRRGGLQTAPLPPFTWEGFKNTIISRMVSMARSGVVMEGWIWGMLMWPIRDVISGVGGILDQADANHDFIAAVNAMMMTCLICSMAHEWYMQIMMTQGGTSTAPGLRGQLAAVRGAGLAVQTARTAALIEEAEDEFRSQADGELATSILRDVAESIGAMLSAGGAVSGIANDGAFRMEDSAIEDFLKMSAAVGCGSAALGFVFQLIALRAVTSPWMNPGRDDPQSARVQSSLFAAGQGLFVGALAQSGAVPWGALPGAAIGVGAATLVDRGLRQARPGAGYPPVAPHAAPLPVDNLVRHGRGRHRDQSFFRFQFEKYREDLMTPIRGLPPLPAAPLAAVAVAGGGAVPAGGPPGGGAAPMGAAVPLVPVAPLAPMAPVVVPVPPVASVLPSPPITALGPVPLVVPVPLPAVPPSALGPPPSGLVPVSRPRAATPPDTSGATTPRAWTSTSRSTTRIVQVEADGPATGARQLPAAQAQQGGGPGPREGADSQSLHTPDESGSADELMHS